jgi:hypothetical protein
MEWISVEDRLPEDETECIGYFEHPYSDVEQLTISEVCFANNRWYWDLCLIKNITHWMPLPKAPKK